ncbi:MAG: hypothetical protein QOK42_843 [Frankiaceae bacterium]|jgi:hypothetical protein|nr:hypothetical protein [Frankiaceae bacterium]
MWVGEDTQGGGESEGVVSEPSVLVDVGEASG